MLAATAATTIYCAHKVQQQLDNRKIPLMGVLGAFVFAAQRIHLAMLSRAFTGDIKIAGQFSFGTNVYLYLAGCTALFTLVRFIDISKLLGQFIL